MRTDILRDPNRVSAGDEGGALMAVYDLAVAPLTFDIMPFLVAAEIARRDAGASHLHFVLVPPGASGNYGEARKYLDLVRARAVTANA